MRFDSGSLREATGTENHDCAAARGWPVCQTRPLLFGMRQNGPDLDLSATDLSNFLACRHRTALDMAVARGALARPWSGSEPDPLLQILWERGLEHERRYVESLVAQGLSVRDLTSEQMDRDRHVALTIAAMRDGVDVIVQGALRDGRWFGKPDVLRRVHVGSDFGAWSYEVADAKLARETRAGTILQLGLYSAMLEIAQGITPESFHVVTPYATHAYRLGDFAAYFRLVRRQMQATIEMDHDDVAAMYYPEPVEHCDICHWSARCRQKRRADDHLSLVAGAGRVHRRELESQGMTTLTQLATSSVDELRSRRWKRGTVETFVRMREQARLQHESRNLEVPKFELRAIVEKKDEGLCRLPEPSSGDVFLDLEGDPFAAEGGREYLFGVVTIEDGSPRYHAFWGMTEKEERRAFEQVMDLIAELRGRHPAMHIYHYAPYEPSAFKRLMGRYVTREKELDDLLRNETFVDLYAVVRQGLVVGTESYSIKRLEPLYGYDREVPLVDANRFLTVVQQALEMNTPDAIPDDVREAVRGYNEDDCISTLRLRDWLEEVRDDHIARGWDIPRPALPQEEAEKLTDRDIQVRALRSRLLEGVPETHGERTHPEHQARWLMAYLLDYHRREAKAEWWEYYRLRDLPEEDLYDEPRAIAELTFEERVDTTLHKKTGKPTGSVVDRYRYPPQEMEIDGGELKLKEAGTWGELVCVDRTQRIIDVKKGPKMAHVHARSAFAHTHVKAAAQEDSLMAVGNRVAADGGVIVNASASDRAGRSLLLALPPRLMSGDFTPPADDEDMVGYLGRTVLSLDHSVLAIQGPPGAGKTYCGARMIRALVASGKRVGVAGPSHKVIRNLLTAVKDAAVEKGSGITIGHKVDEDAHEDADWVKRFENNGEVAQALRGGSVQVAGGTAWLWSHRELIDSVDVLFVDEAGQMSLANVLAMSPSAKSIVLLGDPQQLEQPRKGSHPDGVAISSLEHMLGGARTIPSDRGVFLPETWRMCASITAFTSEVFYEGRLETRRGFESQEIAGSRQLDRAGLWILPMDHDGNRTSSYEEIDAVAELAAGLAEGAMWIDFRGTSRALRGEDILVVAPYNAQVSRLTERLAGTDVRVGTVDKFQGQEAPVVIYSMATSRSEDAPRGMEFLFSGNRLNVATSRARCAAVIVASERLFEPECRTPRQMKLANALCRYRELAGAVGARIYCYPDDAYREY